MSRHEAERRGARVAARGVQDGSAAGGAVRTGSEDALSEVYARWSPLVYSLALQVLADVGAAEDVTRQVFTELWTSGGPGDVGRTSFSAWLIDRSCARIAEVQATRGARPEPVGAAAGEKLRDEESRSTAMAERLVLADGLSHLDAVPQRVLRMVLDDLSPAEVAERTGLSVEDVQSQVASSLIQLRQQWEVPTDAH